MVLNVKKNWSSQVNGLWATSWAQSTVLIVIVKKHLRTHRIGKEVVIGMLFKSQQLVGEKLVRRDLNHIFISNN